MVLSLHSNNVRRLLLLHVGAELQISHGKMYSPNLRNCVRLLSGSVTTRVLSMASADKHIVGGVGRIMVCSLNFDVCECLCEYA